MTITIMPRTTDGRPSAIKILLPLSFGLIAIISYSITYLAMPASAVTWPTDAPVMPVQGRSDAHASFAGDLELRVHAARIKVVDVDAAVAFYHDVLGLAHTRSDDGPIVFDGTSMDLILEQAHEPSGGGYPTHSQTLLVFETSDIRWAMERLRLSGVDLVDGDEPRPYGWNQTTGKPLGLATRFRDPSGIVHSLVEQQVDREPFEGRRDGH